MTLDARQLRAVIAGLPLPPPLPRKRRNNEESVMQRALIKRWQANCRHFGVPEILLFSIPNGGGRSGPRIGSLLKKEGLRAGAPDLFLAAPRRPTPRPGATTPHYSGLFLELKRPDGVVSPEQEVFHELLRTEGYKVCVCRTLQDCINQITSYLT